jgi:hypothetical protein
MRAAVARGIYERVIAALVEGRPVAEVFGHRLKCRAIEKVWADREALLAGYTAAADKVAYCQTLPHIGGITKYHLAKNFGAQVAKPDVHLQRLADLHGCTAQALCEQLAAATGYKVATVDVVLWRACAERIIDSRTGQRAAGASA